MAYPQFERLKNIPAGLDHTPVTPAQVSNAQSANIQTPYTPDSDGKFTLLYIMFGLLAVGIYNARI